VTYEQIAAVVNDAICQYYEQIGKGGGTRWEDCCDVVKKGFTVDVAALVLDPGMSPRALARRHRDVNNMTVEDKIMYTLFVAIVRALL
jgi:hypothetical protein